MRQTIMKFIGLGALLAGLLAPLAYVSGGLGLDACKATLLVSTLVWFAASGEGFLGKNSHVKAEPDS